MQTIMYRLLPVLALLYNDDTNDIDNDNFILHGFKFI